MLVSHLTISHKLIIRAIIIGNVFVMRKEYLVQVRMHTFQQRNLIWPVHPTARPRHLMSQPVFGHKNK